MLQADAGGQIKTESDALTRAQAGDGAAFGELVREHQAMVFSLARYSLRHHETAEELAQEVFLSLYRNLGAIESPAHLKFWLRRVTSNRCIDYVRRQRVPTVNVEDAPEPATTDCHGDALLTATLRRMVATLPARPRLIVTLRYQEDLEPSEIAALLDLPVNTVKSHLRRSLAILKEKVARRLGEHAQ